jgi:lysophospholipid acyltransferase (LPLAT)-like uncharacterized protein
VERNSLLLKVMKLLFIQSVHIIRKIFRYSCTYYGSRLYNILSFFCRKLMFVTIMQFIFSTALDGKIKAWLYDNLGSRVVQGSYSKFVINTSS